jgi:magnesium-transporting ATPase (P-type)
MTWDVYLWKSTIIAAVITFIIGMFTTGVNSLNASIAGYSLLIVTIMGILIQLIRKPITNEEGVSTLKMVWNILMLTGPFFIILGIIGLMLYLFVSNKNPIINNEVSQSFYTFSNITLFLILILIYFIYNNVMCDGADCNGKTGKLNNSIMYLLSILTVVSTGIVYTILTFYRTDGFQVLKNNSEKMQFNYLL